MADALYRRDAEGNWHLVSAVNRNVIEVVEESGGMKADAVCRIIETLLGCVSNTDGAAVFNAAASITYTPKDNFALPQSISVTMRGAVLVEDEDYTWSEVTGVLSIMNVTGDIAVSITCALDGEVYTQCSYLQSSGSEYIDTGVTGSNYTSAEFKFARLSAYPNGWWAVIGACQQDLTRSFLFTVYKAGDVEINVQNGTNKYGEIMFSITPLTPYKVYINKQKTYIDDVLKLTLTSYTYTTPVPLALFWQAYSVSTNMYKAKIRLYYCNIWESTTLVRRFIPCVRNSDMKPGFYDEVSEAFFINAGSGEFTYG